MSANGRKPAPTARSDRPHREAPPSRSAAAPRDPRAGGRETVESIVVAFTLALLFRAFEAEAFVIPTGSMAPTLMGRHKDLVCDSCGEDFRVGCSAELDEATNRIRPERMVTEARCPNCGNPMPLTRGGDAGRSYDPRYPSFSGDRIIVDKFAYDFVEPARWDVVVFKYPEDAKTNYIKRLVGLPGETLTIAVGDIWTKPLGDRAAAEVIARKPPDKLRAMLQVVHDSSHVSAALAKAGWPAAWCDWSGPAGGPARWQSADDGRSFAVSCAAGDSARLRYRHLLPSPAVWRDVRAGASVANRAAPTLVGDFQPYNADSIGPHWVGDLAVELELESRRAEGTVAIDLVEGTAVHRCTIDLRDGRVALERTGDPETVAAAGTSRVTGTGRWRLLFANVDDELRLFVDDHPVAFDRPTTWQRPLAAAITDRPVARGGEPGDPEPGDLAPVGVTATGADVRVGGLRVLRDVYYIASGDATAMAGRTPEETHLDFPLEAGQFFMLGDNSSASKDSRAWGTHLAPLHHVDRHLIIGRALAIFWPHAVPARWSVPVRLGGLEVRLPSWPNFGRMGFVR